MIYSEDEEITSTLILTKGEASFVLPQFEKTEYIKITSGNYFGVECIVGSMIKANNGLENLSTWLNNKSVLKHQFSVAAQTNCELFALQINDLYKIKNEFIEVYNDIF